MGCQLHPSNPQIPTKLPTKKPAQLASFSSAQPKSRIQTAVLSAIAQGIVPETDHAYSVEFRTLGGCKLGIARYPDFEYNADGGTGTGTGTGWKTGGGDDSNGAISVGFDVKTLYIPPLMGATTRFLGLPLPPLLKIEIVPELFEGIVDRKSGQVDLRFKAKFWFSVGSIYRAPPLAVETVLTSEESKGKLRSGRGEKLNEEGKCRLVGVAVVDPIDDFLMDSFLGLPTECLAVLNATISFSGS